MSDDKLNLDLIKYMEEKKKRKRKNEEVLKLRARETR